MNIPSQTFIDAAHGAVYKCMTTSPEVLFRTTADVRELNHLEEDGVVYMGVTFMTGEEIRQSILGDILTATMFELQGGKFYSFNMKDLLTFIPVEHHDLVMNEYVHPDVQALITTINGQLRIKNDRDILTHVMDYSGILYDGYDCDMSDAICASGITKDAYETATAVTMALAGVTDNSTFN